MVGLCRTPHRLASMYIPQSSFELRPIFHCLKEAQRDKVWAEAHRHVDQLLFVFLPLLRSGRREGLIVERLSGANEILCLNARRLLWLPGKLPAADPTTRALPNGLFHKFQ